MNTYVKISIGHRLPCITFLQTNLYYWLIIILLDTLYQCQCPRPSTKMILYYETINQRIKKEKLMIQ